VVCFVISLSSVVMVLLNVYQFGKMSLNSFTWFSIVAVPVLAVICGVLSRRQACKMAAAKEKKLELKINVSRGVL